MYLFLALLLNNEMRFRWIVCRFAIPKGTNSHGIIFLAFQVFHFEVSFLDVRNCSNNFRVAQHVYFEAQVGKLLRRWEAPANQGRLLVLVNVDRGCTFNIGRWRARGWNLAWCRKMTVTGIVRRQNAESVHGAFLQTRCLVSLLVTPVKFFPRAT